MGLTRFFSSRHCPGHPLKVLQFEVRRTNHFPGFPRCTRGGPGSPFARIPRTQGRACKLVSGEQILDTLVVSYVARFNRCLGSNQPEAPPLPYQPVQKSSQMRYTAMPGVKPRSNGCNIVGSCCNMLSRVGQTNATLCNMVAKGTQHIACKMLHQTCCIRLARA